MITNLNQRYRFDIVDGATTYTFPVYNDRLVTSRARDGNRRFYRRTLKSPLRFVGEGFDYFEAKTTAGACLSLPIKIYRRCGAIGTFSLWYEGLLTLGGAKIDYDRRVCEIPVETDDLYVCINRVMKDKFNLQAKVPTRAARNIVGTFESLVCTETKTIPVLGLLQVMDLVDCIPGGAAAGFYAVTSHSQRVTSLSPSISCDFTTEWTREVVTSALPPDESFTSIGAGKWARLPQTVGGQFRENPVSASPGTDFIYKATLLDYGTNLGLDNGQPLNDLLPVLVTNLGCGLGCVSNFFGINPVGFISNNAYDRAEERLRNVLVYERTDVTNWKAESNASILETTFETFINQLCEQFNLGWAIEVISGQPKFRLEHVSYFEASNQNDLTTPQYARYVAGKRNYEFNAREDVPREELFTFGDSKTNYFGPSSILYTNCPNAGPIKERAVSSVSNDLAWLSFGSQSTEGITFVATYQFNSKWYIHYDYGVLNGALSWRELLVQYWLYERHAEDITIKSGTYSDAWLAYSLTPTKRQRQIAIPVDCAMEEAFDPAKKQKTALGWGEVETAEYDTLTNVLTLNLLHE